MVGTAQGRLLPTLQSRFQTASFADTASRSRRRFARGLILNFPPSHNRGRRECRAPDAPDSRVCNDSDRTHTRSQVTPESPDIPRAMVYGLFRALPGDRALLPPSFREITPRTLTPASGCQDHTFSPSASGALVRSAIRVHRSPPRAGDVAQRPSLIGTGWRII